jgi:hypothetical protein
MLRIVSKGNRTVSVGSSTGKGKKYEIVPQWDTPGSSHHQSIGLTRAIGMIESSGNAQSNEGGRQLEDRNLIQLPSGSQVVFGSFPVRH